MLIKRKAVFLLFLALLVTLLAFLFTNFHSNLISDKNLVQRFQSDLIDEEKKMDEVLQKTSALFSGSDSTLSFEELSNYVKNSDSDHFTICIYKSDSLIFWSDNNVKLHVLELDSVFNNNFRKIYNGWYDLRKSEVKDFLLIGLIKIKNAYSYENDYLNNEFASFVHLQDEIEIVPGQSENEIYNSEGDLLFSLDTTALDSLPSGTRIFLALAFILAFVLLIASLYHWYVLLNGFFRYKSFLFICFVIDVLIIRVLILYFEFPSFVHSSPLFDPEYYASSMFSASLGDMLLNLFSLLAISYASFHYFNFNKISVSRSQTKKSIFSFLLLFAIYFAFHILYLTFDGLVYNSTISFDIANITSITFFSILGFLCFGLLIFSFFLLTFKPILFVVRTFSNKYLLILILFVFLVFSFILYNNYYNSGGYHNVFLFAYFLAFVYIDRFSHQNIRFSTTLAIILLFSMFTTFSLDMSVANKEKANRLVMAQNLAGREDPVLEYNFQNISEDIQSDTTFNTLLKAYPFEEYEDLENVTSYLHRNYFTSYFSKYDVLLTLCDSTRVLDIQPDDIIVNCFDFFYSDITEYGEKTDTDNLYFIDYDYLEDNYLGIIELQCDFAPVNLFVEIFSKNIPKGLGYPELLRDSEEESEIKWSDYSYARYEKGTLISRFGRFFFATKLGHYNLESVNVHYFDRDGYSHLFYPEDENNVVIISIKTPGFIDFAAPFSYISIFYGLLAFLLFIILKSPVEIKFSQFGFKKRLQLSVTALIVVSFLFVGAGSLYYLVTINNNKNLSILSEKSHSVLIEMEHKLASEENLPREMESYLSNLLYKFSLVFFSDINLYALDGRLLATSRPEVFNKGLKSEMINSTAFVNIQGYKKSLFIQEEKIGEYSYLSAYLPFRNDDNKLIAYLNLPYFAKQDELTNEISTFLVAFVNVYVILIAFSIYIALIISNYITKPVELIKQKISKLKLGKIDQKIEWKRQDEIGSLVAEYNRKVEELAQSAELLAKSERESAWREMAKQIAHEIKNPLTPMKLSVQYLQKAWDEKTPDWEERLQRFTNTIIEQIDSLSIIASEFSDFAKMPRTRLAVIELSEIISNSIGIFKEATKIEFEFKVTSNHYVFADKEQLLRVFNNLIKNSIQAIPEPGSGIIAIDLKTVEDNHIVQVTDNGKGIPEDQKSKVFYPNFTTKSGGMGLGLALVKNIIENSNGSISFESEEEKGTTFIITLPLAEVSEL